MIGDNIKFYRKKNQLTQDDIAEACNVTRQAVSKWENGTGTPDIANLMAIAALFQISVDELLSNEKSEKKRGTMSPLFLFPFIFSLVFLSF